MKRSPEWAVAMVIVAVLTLAGCAGLPSSGSVRSVDEGTYSPGDSRVRRLALPPPVGASPEEVVRGFLAAAAGMGDDAETMMLYLDARAKKEWDPLAGVTVVESASVSVTPPVANLPALPTLQGGPGSPAASPDRATQLAETSESLASPTESRQESRQVYISGSQVASIDPRGGYRLWEAEKPLVVPVTVVKDSSQLGEWRIDRLPDGMVLPAYVVERSYRSMSVFFLDDTDDRLVGDPVVLPDLHSLPTLLTRRLLQGPSAHFGAGLRTAVAAGTRLDAEQVAVEEGVAEVSLTQAPSSDRLEALAAQLLFTLRQVGGITGVRLWVQGTQLTEVGMSLTRSMANVERFTPDPALAQPVPLYVALSGRVGRTAEGGFTPLSAVGTELASPAAAVTGTPMAALSVDRRRLYTVGATSEEPTKSRWNAQSGNRLSGLSVDASGTIWAVEHPTSVSTNRSSGTAPILLALRAEGAEATVGLALPQGVVRAARVSRDGGRVAVVVQVAGRDQLYVGNVVTKVDGSEGKINTGAFTRVAPNFAAIGAVAWQDGQTLAVLASQQRGISQPYLLSLDGFRREELNPLPATAVSIAAAPGQAVVVGTTNRVFQSSGRTWREIARGAEPAFPG